MNGYLAKKWCDLDLPVQVLRSAAGYYLGTEDEYGSPVSRESVHYYRTYEEADEALRTGTWVQRPNP